MVGGAPRRLLHRCNYARLKRRPEMNAQRLATLESDNVAARAGRDLGAVLGTIYLGAQTGEKMDTKPKDDKLTEFDLEIAVFSAP